MSDNIKIKLNYNYCVNNNQQFITPAIRDVNSGHIQVNNDSQIVYDNNCELIYPDDVPIIGIGRSDSRFIFQKRNIGSSYTSYLESCRIKDDLQNLDQQNKINIGKNQNPIYNCIQPNNNNQPYNNQPYNNQPNNNQPNNNPPNNNPPYNNHPYNFQLNNNPSNYNQPNNNYPYNIQPNDKYICSTVMENPMEYQGTSNVVANQCNYYNDYNKICYYCYDNLAELEKNRIHNIRLSV